MHLYIHIPFCHRICPYCAFFKHTPGATDMKAFIEGLIQEVKLRIPIGYAPETIFFGGGTPSMLSPTHFTRLIEGLRSHIDFSQVKEWSLEANPATFNLVKASLWKSMGVNRVSLGVQSFHPELLKLLGREHSPEHADSSVEILRMAGIKDINIDLMYSLPGQNIEQWEDSLRHCIALEVDHVSCYNLTYEEGTAFYQQYGERLCNEELDEEMFLLADKLLGEAGFRHYEISNYARRRSEGDALSLHNLAYWQGKDYYGIGPGAFGTINDIRYENLGDTKAYSHNLALGKLPAQNIEQLDAGKRRSEQIGLGLRCDWGISKEHIRPEDEGYLTMLFEEGLAQHNKEGRICLSTRGMLVADEIAVGLL